MSLKKHSTYYEDRQLDQLASLAEIEGRDVSKILREIADEFIRKNAHKLELRRSFGGGALMKRLGGELGEGTVLFFGIERFAERIHGRSAEQTGAFLQQLYHVAGEIALAHGGRVVKFMGDGGLLFFEGDDHAERGAAAGLALKDSVPPIDTRTPAALSIGAASGELLIGHFGHEQFFQFDVVGDTVNTGFGMRTLAADTIIVNDDMKDRLDGRFAFDEIGTTDIPGLGDRRGWRLEAE